VSNSGPTTFRTLGRTGLRVSPFALGTMTFGWGTDKDTALRLFRAYRNAGGNFMDTADMYAGGTSEEWLGEMIATTRSRDEIVLATKFSFSAQPGNPNAGGNGRKNILRALEGSLRRLRTDYIDL
jgi:aryl-alcohol dehydrogenase-like predicted oxidoreductase